jgi:hypothetical protein
MVMTDDNPQLIVELKELQEALQDSVLPPDDYDHHFHLKPLQPSENETEFNLIVDAHMDNLVGGRHATAAANLRRHFVYILLNLGKAAMANKWLVLSLDKAAYAHDKTLKSYGLLQAPTKAIVDYLERHNQAVVLKGKKYNNNPARTRLYPKPEMAALMVKHFLDSSSEIKPPYVLLNEGEDGWREAVAQLPKGHPDKADLTKINEFLMDHAWACKGPVVLKYKHTVFQSGRLYTDHQELPDRRFRIRINTRIDSESVCEVDFNANHLRLALAVLHGEDAGDSPYEDIMDLAGQRSRDLVKSFITKAMGAYSREAAHSSWNLDQLGSSNFREIEAATNKRFPMLKLYDDWGIHAQNLEGAILRDVMLQSVDKGIVVLPVHDAVAVQQKHEDWAIGTMLEAWSRVAARSGAARARIKVDRP